ncbi:MAG TPA: sugar-binding transcriptional regulator [Anaeromyxobacteraceae bacterium]|nr:sugar-binding transcriptional regulator [Anaeromyxobacteraceae bacterium]
MEPYEARLLYRVAQAYYEDDLTQEEIGDQFGLSRVTICRLLNRAREAGIVRISVSLPGSGCGDMERALERRYGLREAVVAPRTTRLPLLERLGSAAASLFTRAVKGCEVVGISWGGTLRAFVESLSRLELPELRVVQIIGGLGSMDAGINGAELTRRLAERCGARPRMIQAPGIVASPDVRAALLADPQVAEAIELGKQADVALVTVGVPARTSAILGPSALLKPEELEVVVRKGGVGEIAFRFFDSKGRYLETELDERVVGLDAKALARIPLRIAMAGGPEKLAAIGAALQGGLVNVLVTDEESAEALLAGVPEGAALTGASAAAPTGARRRRKVGRSASGAPR